MDGFWQRCVNLRPWLVWFAEQRCGSLHDAEDVVHEAFVAAALMESLDHTRMVPVLVAAIKRLSVEFARRDALAREVGCHPGLLPLDEQDPAEVVSDRAEAEWMLSRCGRLSGWERSVLLWRADGRPHEEISRMMGTTRRSTERAVSRARLKVRHRLAMRART